ncbi:toxin-activating lysine-acyltransferase [Alginatibacterium sediminis]|uniref:RTX toxin-activating lysine-acyltransferase n=1 Tax=Alginatibacterium sediminis TaxID=2164068 RepID=A0A420EAU1_9ALTE|nr:toxin-activating lysine-acyltransferase [Alginatibacterium sediminis]RKF17790.1 toxin-activating lysine-acyltransferase [Alginatibacterium sediminis]
MSELDRYQIQGICLELLAQSKQHKHAKLSEYLDLEILPAIEYRQLRIYKNEANQAIGFVTWAWLNQSNLSQLLASNSALNFAQWNSGEILFFNDFVAPYGGVRFILNDLCRNVFPSYKATSFSRNLNGQITKQHYWFGKEYRKNKMQK